MRFLVLILLLAGLVLSGVLGTGTRMLFQWPGYLALGLAGVVSLVLWRAPPRYRPRGRCLVMVAVFAGYLVARALTSPVAYLARGDLTLVLAGLVVFGLTAICFPGSRERTVIFWCLVAIAFANLAFGAVQYSAESSFWIIPGYSRTYPEGRIGGLFNNPNHLGAALCFTALLCLGQALLGRCGKAGRAINFFAAGSMVLGIFLTLSRGALLGLAGGLLALAVFGAPALSRRLKQVQPSTLVAGAALVLATVAGGAVLSFSLLRERIPGEAVFQETARVHYWKAALDQIEASPVIGAGSRAYHWLNRLYRPDDLFTAEGEIEFAHNEYLQLAADYGLVGLILFAIAVGMCFANGRRYLRRAEIPRRRCALAAGSAAGLAALFVQALFDFHFHSPAVVLPAAFAFGVLANPGFEEPECAVGAGRAHDSLRKVWRAGIAFAAAAILCLGAGPARSEFFFEQAKRYQSGRTDLTDVPLLARAHALDSRNPEILLTSARSWEARAAEGLPEEARRSFLERARRDYEKACRLDPYNIYALVPLANCLDSLGEAEAARSKYEDAMSRAPRFQYCLLSYGMFLHRAGDWDGAAEVYQRCYRAHALENIDESMNRVRDLEAILARDRKRGGTRP